MPHRTTDKHATCCNNLYNCAMLHNVGAAIATDQTMVIVLANHHHQTTNKISRGHRKDPNASTLLSPALQGPCDSPRSSAIIIYLPAGIEAKKFSPVAISTSLSGLLWSSILHHLINLVKTHLDSRIW